MSYEIVKRATLKQYDVEFSNDSMYVYSKDLKLIDTIELSVNNLSSNTSDEVFKEIIEEYLNR